MSTRRRTLILSLFVAALALTQVAGAAFVMGGPSWSAAKNDEGACEFYGTGVDQYSYTSNNYNCAQAVGKWYLTLKSTTRPNGKLVCPNWAAASDKDVYSWDYESATDWFLVEAADHAYFAGHGNSGMLAVDGAVGDHYVTASETEWGDDDFESVALDSCLNLDAWGSKEFAKYNLNDGIHFIGGFKGYALDVAWTGAYYADYLKKGYYFVFAWIFATMDSHPAKNNYGNLNTAALLVFHDNSCNPVFDTFFNTCSCDPTSATTYTYFTWNL